MTDTPKPLTADEIAERKRMIAELGGNRFEARYIATIEQQREQIERLRQALKPTFGPGRIVEYDQQRKKMNIPEADFQTICEALASTEPPK